MLILPLLLLVIIIIIIESSNGTTECGGAELRRLSSSEHGRYLADACAANQYCDSSYTTPQCTNCPVGKTSPSGSSSVSNCTAITGATPTG